MVTHGDVRELALALPDVREEGPLAYSVRSGSTRKGIAWPWRERIHPRKPRVVNPDVLAVRVADLEAKEMLLLADPDTFFTEPHYDGYAAVLVRLERITRAALRGLLQQACAAQATKRPRSRSAAGTTRATAPRKKTGSR
ncbi:hypothetical protein [Dokdonella fugitiva]|jgi:hypothetical protein|uniref:YjbR protein n=1 Tax=Dokdonella fugitiva TaxID=328517 RepID=A0A4R2I0T4_9GAMM|nr:hypothetical protein [Dokdonella fugitiva]MBA8884565.1 hypothetical protein [Dokdonella fugitiva]TCO37246.1 hypothetical protein EV148_11057 [Dokdonella fugitiva]